MAMQTKRKRGQRKGPGVTLQPERQERHSFPECTSERTVNAVVRYGPVDNGGTPTGSEWTGIGAKAVFPDGPLSLETAMYLETKLEKEWDNITLERFDAQVNVLVALRDKLFAVAVPDAKPLVVRPEEQPE